MKSIFKIYIVILTILFSAALRSAAQRIGNYVANGSFEQYYDCSFPLTLTKTKHWMGIDSLCPAAGWLSVCNGYVPNGWTSLYPKTGDAYIISSFYQYNYLGINTNRWYPKNRLKANLQIGRTYCVTFYVCLTNASPRGIDGFGAYFGNNSVDTITHCTIPLTYLTPQVQNPLGNVISDALNWVVITGTYTANGTEKFLLLGNFLSDNAVTTTSINTPYYPETWTDVLIDDVSCIPIDLDAYAGKDTTIYLGDSAYIGREPDFAIDTGCVWYQLPNTTTSIDTISGMWVKPTATGSYTYVVRQELECSGVKWDTVVVTVRDFDVGVGELEIKNFKLEIYPNPAREMLNVELEIKNEELEIRIVDVLGKEIINDELKIKNGKGEVDVSSLQNGVYMICFTDNKKRRTITKKFLIAR